PCSAPAQVSRSGNRPPSGTKLAPGASANPAGNGRSAPRPNDLNLSLAMGSIWPDSSAVQRGRSAAPAGWWQEDAASARCLFGRLDRRGLLPIRHFFILLGRRSGSVAACLRLVQPQMRKAEEG